MVASRSVPAQPTLVKHVSQGDTVKLKSVGRPGMVTRRIDDNHFEVEIGAMKMKIARDDIAEVVIRSSDSPVNAARARGISVSLVALLRAYQQAHLAALMGRYLAAPRQPRARKVRPRGNSAR